MSPLNVEPLPPPFVSILALKIAPKFHFCYLPSPQRRCLLWMVPCWMKGYFRKFSVMSLSLLITCTYHKMSILVYIPGLARNCYDYMSELHALNFWLTLGYSYFVKKGYLLFIRADFHLCCTPCLKTIISANFDLC